MAENNTCFVIAPIGESGSLTRKRSDQILKHLVAPACKECGYGTPIRADQIDESGLITNQVIQHLVNDRLVIADLSDRNPNVFYELAIRHAFRKPVIQLIRSGETIPFDVAGLRTVEIDHQDLDIIETAKEQLVQHMKAVQAKPNDVESPVSIAVDLSLLRSGNAQQREMALVLDLLGKINQQVSMLSNAVVVAAPNSNEPWRVGSWGVPRGLGTLASLGSADASLGPRRDPGADEQTQPDDNK
jgi:hypothetical protein